MTTVELIKSIAFDFGWTVSTDEEEDTVVFDFDPDYEAYWWIGHDGHGKCSAPYHIKDIVDEMEEAKRLFTDFYNSLKTALT